MKSWFIFGRVYCKTNRNVTLRQTDLSDYFIGFSLIECMSQSTKTLQMIKNFEVATIFDMSSVTRRHYMYIFTVIGRINQGTQFTKSLGDILVLFPLFHIIHILG